MHCELTDDTKRLLSNVPQPFSAQKSALFSDLRELNCTWGEGGGQCRGLPLLEGGRRFLQRIVKKPSSSLK